MARTDSISPLLLVTDDPQLTDELLRLCAAAGASAEIVADASQVRARVWRSAAAVLIDGDAAQAITSQRARLPSRDGVLIASCGPPQPRLWELAVALRAERVFGLPESAPDLVRRLGDLLEGANSACLTVGVVAARGGSGASTLATGLAVTAARYAITTLLIDADPRGGGIDLVVGLEDVDGLRWPEVSAAAGRVSSSALRAALPGADDLAVLSWDRRTAADVDASTVSSIVAAAQRGSRLVVIDLPRRLDDVAGLAAAACDLILVLCPTDVRAVAGALRLLPFLGEFGAEVQVVLRSSGGAVVDGEDLAEMLGLRLAGTVPTKSGLVRLIDEGLGIPTRGAFTAACRDLLDDLGVLEETG